MKQDPFRLLKLCFKGFIFTILLELSNSLFTERRRIHNYKVLSVVPTSQSKYKCMQINPSTQPLLLHGVDSSHGTFMPSKAPVLLDPHNDPMLRDKRVLSLSNPFHAIPAFILSFFVLTPVWLLLLLPLTLLSQCILALYRLMFPLAKGAQQAREDPKKLIASIVKHSNDTKGRSYDLIVFGATGFTGKLAAMYLAKNYFSNSNKPANFKWAIAGRRRDALESVREQLALINPALKNLDLLVADANDQSALDNMVKQTKVVVTAAGESHRC